MNKKKQQPEHREHLTIGMSPRMFGLLATVVLVVLAIKLGVDPSELVSPVR